SSLLIGSFALIGQHRHHCFLRPCPKKLSILFEWPVDDDRGGYIILCLENADLDIISHRCTVEKHTDVAGIRDSLVLLLDLAFEPFDFLEMLLHIAVVIDHLDRIELTLKLT